MSALDQQHLRRSADDERSSAALGVEIGCERLVECR
jgi:hypothetical protein